MKKVVLSKYHTYYPEKGEHHYKYPYFPAPDEYRMTYPGKEAYVFSTPLKNPFPWLNPAYQERIIEKGDFVRDLDHDEKIDDEE